MKLGVIGTRGFTDYDLMKSRLDNFKDVDTIVSGGAIGADKLSERYAEENNIPAEIYLPDYSKHGRKAPFIRNTLIVEASDFIIAFWDGKSKGTKDSLVKAATLNKPVKIVYYGLENNLEKFE